MHLLRGDTQSILLDIVCSLDTLWGGLAGIGTAVLAFIAVLAYFTAKGQLEAAVEARRDAVRIARPRRLLCF